MGLDSTIRKLSKAKARTWGVPPAPPAVGAPFSKVPGSHHLLYEIAYWRNFRPLNTWMMALARNRVDPERRISLDYDIMNGAAIILHEEDIMALKMEAVFGNMFHKYWRERDTHLVTPPGLIEDHVGTDIEAFDRLLRIAKHNRSYIYYIASW